MQSDKLVGSTISLVTNAQVRYEGVLVSIDRKERSMKLENVKSHGSEGRREGKGEVPAKNDLIGSVIFRVDHIRDFQIVKPAPESKQEQFEDDAIISSEPTEPAKEKPQPQAQEQREYKNQWRKNDQREPRQDRPKGPSGILKGKTDSDLKE